MHNLMRSILSQEKFDSPLLLHGAHSKHLEETARQLAADILLLSKNGTTEKKIQTNQHPDLSILQPEGKSDLYSIEMIQGFIKESTMPPFEGRYKIYLFLHAERMLPIHANALLKTFEEKKPFTVIILTTTNILSILPTIQSRCQKIPLFLPENETPAIHPNILQVIKLSIARQYAQLIKAIEVLEKEEVPLSDITNALLHYHRDLFIQNRGLPINSVHQAITPSPYSIIPFEALAKRIETAFEAQDRNIKFKHILEYLLT